MSAKDNRAAGTDVSLGQGNAPSAQEQDTSPQLLRVELKSLQTAASAKVALREAFSRNAQPTNPVLVVDRNGNVIAHAYHPKHVPGGELPEQWTCPDKLRDLMGAWADTIKRGKTPDPRRFMTEIPRKSFDNNRPKIDKLVDKAGKSRGDTGTCLAVIVPPLAPQG